MRRLEADSLRQRAKLAKAYNDEWNYKMMSEAIGITPHAFYNWLNGYYELSKSKESELCGLLDDLLAQPQLTDKNGQKRIILNI